MSPFPRSESKEAGTDGRAGGQRHRRFAVLVAPLFFGVTLTLTGCSSAGHSARTSTTRSSTPTTSASSPPVTFTRRLPKPFGFAFDRNGDVLVADFLTGEVDKLDRNWRYVSTLATLPAENSRHCGSTGLAIGPGDDIYVANDCNADVEILDRTGKAIRAIPTGNNAPDVLGSFGGGTVFGNDYNHGQVLAFAANSTEPHVFHDFGGPDPWGIAVDRKGDVFVGLVKDDKVVELSPSGTVLASSPSLGSASDEVDNVTVDSIGRVYVTTGSDQGHLQVEQLSPQLAPLRLVARFGSGPGEVASAGAIEVGAGDDLYVFDLAGRVLQFGPNGNLMNTFPVP